MLCERCKIREANIRYTEVVNGVKTEHNLCGQCAKELDFGHYSAFFDGDFPLGKLLSGLLGIEDSSQKKEEFHHIICPTCNTSYEDFIKDSRFGCQDCYSVFSLLMDDSMKQLQGSDIHTGKRPKQQQGRKAGQPEPEQVNLEVNDTADMIQVLKARLSEALSKEEYELAAQYRDQIKALKEEIGDGKVV